MVLSMLCVIYAIGYVQGGQDNHVPDVQVQGEPNGQGAHVLLQGPGVSHSHINFVQRLSQSLTSPEHQVTVWMPQFVGLPNHTHFGSGIQVQLIPWFENEEYDDEYFQSKVIYAEPNYWRFVKLCQDWEQDHLTICHSQLHEHQTQLRALASRQWQLAVTHTMSGCSLLLLHQMDIALSSTVLYMAGSYVWDNAAVMHGVDRNPSYVVQFYSVAGDRMSFWQRLSNLLILWHGTYTVLNPQSIEHREALIYNQWLRQSHGTKAHQVHIYKLGQATAGIIMNGQQILDFPRPLYQNMAYIGNIQSTTQHSALDPFWTQLAEDTDYEGFIVVSFGTLADTKYMPTDMKMAMLMALSQMSRYRVFWRFAGEFPEADQVAHITRVNWLPQHQLLKHARCRCFLTHGGFNSLFEGATSAVPMVMAPLFADQTANAQRAQRMGIALTIPKHLLTHSQAIYQRLHQVCSNKRFHDKAVGLVSMLSDQILPQKQGLSAHLHWITKPAFKRVYCIQKVAALPYYVYYYGDLLGTCLILIITISQLIISS